MFPIMGAYIAYSIADRPGLLTGMVAGALAANGGSSFLGAVIGGFAAGYIILGLKKLTAGIPRSLEGIKTLLLFPILGLALTSLAMLAINSVVAPVSNALTDFLSGLSGTNAALLGAVIGGMLALDLGGSHQQNCISVLCCNTDCSRWRNRTVCCHGFLRLQCHGNCYKLCCRLYAVS